jgi:hypothetical protein
MSSIHFLPRGEEDLTVKQRTLLFAIYRDLGESFDVHKGHIYLEIRDELTGDDIFFAQFPEISFLFSRPDFFRLSGNLQG